MKGPEIEFWTLQNTIIYHFTLSRVDKQLCLTQICSRPCGTFLKAPGQHFRSQCFRTQRGKKVHFLVMILFLFPIWSILLWFSKSFLLKASQNYQYLKNYWGMPRLPHLFRRAGFIEWSSRVESRRGNRVLKSHFC